MLPLQRVISLTKNATGLFMVIMSPRPCLFIKNKTFAMIPLMVQLIRLEMAATGMSVTKTLVDITMTITSVHMICAALAEVKYKNKNKNKNKTFAIIPIMVQLIRLEMAATGMSVAKTIVEITMTETSMHMICAALAEAKYKNKTFAMIPPMVQLIQVEIPATGMSIAKTTVEITMTVTSMQLICAALAEEQDHYMTITKITPGYMNGARKKGRSNGNIS